MQNKFYLSICLFFFVSVLVAQQSDLYNSKTIPPKLLKNSNAVIRFEKQVIDLKSKNSMAVSFKRISTVFNENGLNTIESYLSYDNSLKIKKIGANIYDKNGNLLEKVKESDFKDVSSVNSFSLYEDSRLKYLGYTPREYPLTIEFYFETETKNTVLANSFTPLINYYISTENSEYILNNLEEIELNIVKKNLDQFPIDIIENDHSLRFVANNLESILPEDYSPTFRDLCPMIRIAPKEFYYEGLFGRNSTWEEMGRWMYNELLIDGFELPESTKNEVLSLVSNVNDPIEKAKLVYEYMQNNTRYISVQEGIGGIKPIDASTVNSVKYGDCKGLTNYTKALLNVVGVESHYSRVFASQNHTVDIDKDFVSFVGHTNHVILNIPNENGDIWLECTNQTNPFGFIAGFTDDRDVLVVTPEGGKIVHTKAYSTEENLQETKADVKLDAQGNLEADVEIKTYGHQYALRRDLQFLVEKDKSLKYKSYWGDINNLSLMSMDMNDDKEQICFTEKVQLTAENYSTISGPLMLVELNAFNKFGTIPTRYTKRSHDFEIDRGFTDIDEFNIQLPDGLAVEALPNNVEIESKFGTYKFSVEEVDGKQLNYKRTFILNKGYYPKEEYTEFRSFLASVVKNDKTKMALKSN